MRTKNLYHKQITLYDMRLASGKPGSGAARLCGTTYRSLRNWETGIAIPNIVNVQDLLQIYGCSFYQLDLALYSTSADKEKQKRIDAASRKPIPVSDPPEIRSLYEMRKMSHLSGAVIAQLCGISYRSLRNWETGAAIPNVIHVNDLLQLYGFSFYELDLTPFYTAFEKRSNKQREMDAQTDNPLRERRRFTEASKS
ncbi:helix-turn-helix domain-containing protein [Metabacillus sp. SLBN-84]